MPRRSTARQKRGSLRHLGRGYESMQPVRIRGGLCLHISRAGGGGFTDGTAYRESTKPPASAFLAFGAPLSHRSRAPVKGKVVPNWRGRATRLRAAARQASKQEWNQPIAKHGRHAAVRPGRRRPACHPGGGGGLRRRTALPAGRSQTGRRGSESLPRFMFLSV